MKISDYYTYAPKSKIKAGDANPNGKYQFYTSSPDESRRCDEYLYDCKATVMGTGGSATLHYYDGKFSTSTDCLTLIPNEKIRAKYLYYFFLANMDVLEAGFKGAGLKHTSKGYIDNIEITKIPSLPSQDKIVNLFDELALRIEKERRQIEKLDELVKARFVEMFSCDKSNIKKLSELTETITKGTTPTTAGFSFEDDGINFFKIESITDDHRVNLQKVAHVNEECHSTFKRSQLKEGDVLFSIAGAIGRTAIIHDKDLPGNTNQALAIIRLKANSNVSRKYLISALESPEVVEQYRKKKRGVAQMNLSLQDIGNISIPVPNSTKQSEFEKFAQQIDKSKFAVQKSLEKTQLLFDSLMQEYFD